MQNAIPPSKTAFGHFKSLMVLGLPLIGSQLAQFGLNLTDSLMLGRYSVEALAASVLATTFFIVLFIVGVGFAVAVTPLVASASEQGDVPQIRRATRMGLWIVAIYGFICLIPFYYSRDILLLIGQEPELSADARAYLGIAGWGLVFGLFGMVLRNYLSAVEHTRVVFWASIAVLLVNGILNYALIFGNLGAPEMGIRGAAWGSLIAAGVVTFLFMAIYILWALPEHQIFARIWKPDWTAFGEVFRLGWPIGITLLAEIGLFSMASFMVGWVDTQTLAAHGIALQLTSLTFMVLLGWSNAATIRAAKAQGAGDMAGLRLGAKVATWAAMGYCVITSVTFIVVPEPLIGLFMNPADPEFATIVTLGIPLVAMAAVFQFADGLQVMSISVLRGLQDTRIPMFIATFAYWGVGIPAAYVAGFVLDYGAIGVWSGLVLGLVVAAIWLTLRLWRGALMDGPREMGH